MKTRRRKTTKPNRGKQATVRRAHASSGTNLREELDQRTRELADMQKRLAAPQQHLAEVLEQQTATSDLLGVISRSPGELAPVFDTMLANAVRLCEAKFGNLFLHEGGALRIVASHDVPAEVVQGRRRRG